jgi:hypothetical protein
VQVVEADAPELVSIAADRDHARAVGRLKQRQQPARQREVAEVVHAELHLEALGGLPLGNHHQPGVVDEEVEAGVPAADLVRGARHGVEIGEVDLEQPDVRTGMERPDPLESGLAALPTARTEEHLRPALGEHARVVPADPAVGPRDEGHASALVRDVALGPARHRTYPSAEAGSTQIGDDQARSWIVVGRSGRGSTPLRRASHVDQRHVGFSSTRT